MLPPRVYLVTKKRKEMKMEKVVNLMKEQKVRRGKASANRGWGGMNELSLLWVIVFRTPRSVLCTILHFDC